MIYDSLVRQTRQKIHGNVAETLEGSFVRFGKQHPEVLGRHWDEAGKPREALSYYLTACNRFAEQGAHFEAAKLSRQALDLVRGQPESDERDEVELSLLILKAASMNTTDG